MPVTIGEKPTAETADLRSEPLGASAFSLSGIDVYTNTLCNAAVRESPEKPSKLCDYCFLSVDQLRSRNMMSRESFGQILDWAGEEDSPVEQITLLGGEFALHPDAGQMVKAVYAEGFSPRIVTNGSREFRDLLDDPEIVDVFRDPERDGLIAVSLDNLRPEANDRHRGEGAHGNAIATMWRLKELGMPFRINTTIMLGTRHRLGELFRFAADEVGATGVNIHSFSDVGRGESLSGGADSKDFPGARKLWEEGILPNVASGRQSYPELDIQVELGFAGTGLPGENLGGCAVRNRTNLQFCVPPDGTDIIPVIACGLQMSQPHTSAYVFREGQLWPRQGPSELTMAKEQTSGCPLPTNLGKICIYDRLDESSLA